MLFSIRPFSLTNVWASGDQGILRHFDGTDWTEIILPTLSTLYAMDGFADDDIWVGGSGGFLAHYDGSAWETVVPLFTEDIRDFTLTDTGEIFAAASGGMLMGYDGTQWYLIESPSLSAFQAAEPSGGGDLWAGGMDGALLRYDFVPLPPTPTPAPTGTPPDDPTATPPIPTSTVPSPATPTPSPSATEPGTTATPTPLPCSVPSIRLRMGDTDLVPGDLFLLELDACNPEDPVFAGDVYLLLEIGGRFWCWPSWQALESGLDYREYDLAPRSILSVEILRFPWPAGAGAYSGARFLGAMFHRGTWNLSGDIQSVSWGFH